MLAAWIAGLIMVVSTALFGYLSKDPYDNYIRTNGLTQHASYIEATWDDAWPQNKVFPNLESFLCKEAHDGYSDCTLQSLKENTPNESKTPESKEEAL
jgi:hypothetical protein